jgi:hypothetical protein
MTKHTVEVTLEDLATIISGLVEKGLCFTAVKLANGDYLITITGF